MSEVSLKNVSIVIPSLDPDKRLAGVVDGLLALGFEDIILVNDGSKEENLRYFPEGEHITCLTHEVNKGKGEALKTAYRYILENRPECLGCVTCDGDGQHLGKDILRTAERMAETGKVVLGSRDFSGEDVPAKSRVGNHVSALIISIVCGFRITDTQTGLRGIPARFLADMEKVEGSRFEYETNVLLELKSMGAECEELKIETVYLDENKSSHYRPVRDSLRIFGLILKYLLSSVISFLVDMLLYTILNTAAGLPIVLSTVLARAVSSVTNFLLNKKMVFRSGNAFLPTVLKYYAVAIPVMLISAFGVKGLAALFSISENSPLLIVVKLVVDTVLFILNFKIQKTWIFAKNKAKNKTSTNTSRE